MSQKKLPTYDLDAFKLAFSTVQRLGLTGSALKDATALGFARADIVATIQTMRRQHFYKSMTTHHDHTTWQDVYHVPFHSGVLYVKFTANVLTEFKLLSFKEK